MTIVNKLVKGIAVGGLAVGLGLVSNVSLAAPEIVLRTVSYFPKQVDLTQQFLEFVKEVNDDKSLGVEIKFLGGPEVIPSTQQGLALKNGVVDVVYGPSNNYYSDTRAGEALPASTIDAEQARKTGGMKLLNSIYEKKLNAHLLGWFGSGVHFFHVWTNTEPKFSADGNIEGHLPLRSVELYQGVLQGMGFNPVTVQVPDVYTALQRGAVKGVTWPTVGVGDLGWMDYLKYRVDPGFFNNTTLVMVNLKTWNKIPADKRAKLQEMADRFEVKSTAEFVEVEKKTMETFKAKGGQIYNMPSAAAEKFKHLATTVPWEEMRKSGMPAAQVEALRKAFNPGQ